MLDPYARYPRPTINVPTFKEKIDKWVANEGQNFLYLSAWVFLQVLMFMVGLIKYGYEENLSGARGILGITLPLARASAVAIHVDTGLILLPMCRNILSFLRTTYIAKVVPFDQNIEFHKMVGWTLLGFSLLHTFAHYVNFYMLAIKIPDGPGWMFYAFVTGPGWTGHVILVALVLIVVTALSWVRMRWFEVFWYTHHSIRRLFLGLLLPWCILPRQT
ncbi:hypothetical protein DSO57_1033611 [Entomophthora muscae]|uniref:Uncharacterized protein n=1 Tax=Entomophthora muscae TaxID=34485 RepID=A0ACC2RER5_9FUNG|nr:hypothetical protein DSO57_1033611 [Entomophthora muscae]